MVHKILSKLLRVMIDVETELDENGKPNVFRAENEVVVLQVSIQSRANEAISGGLNGRIIPERRVENRVSNLPE